MKKIILSIAIISTAFAFAQKKEVQAAFKAVEGNDFATASSKISETEASMGDKTYLLDPATLEQYYFAKGISLLKSGKTADGAAYLAKIADLGKSKVYAGKDSNKNKVYFVGKAAADASGISGLKEEIYSPSLTPKIIEQVNPLIEKANKEAMDGYNAKKFSVAAPKFNEVYNLLKAAGQNNMQYLYYSAITYQAADDKPKAAELFSQLINSGYTGVETSYLAKNKETGKEESIGKENWELQKKLGAVAQYTDFKTETSKSVEHELYETGVALYIETEKYDEAIDLASRGIKKFPSNSRLSELQGLAYYRSGKTDQFIANLKDVVAKNPQDKASWYNLGVLASKDEAKQQEAIGYFNKAIEIDPKYGPALQNLAFLVADTENDQKHIDEYNSLRKAGKSAEANKIIEARRERFAKALPYAEKWYEAEPNNIDAVSFLKSIYNSMHNEAKYKELKAKEEALQKQQK